MILIGQYDSPFVRRVAVAMHLYNFPYEHRPWSVWSDAEALARVNPLLRVPTLVLDDGTALVESSAILDVLDETVGAERALLPRSGIVRRDGLRVSALATGIGDKAVSLFYEPLLRSAPSEVWLERCRCQIAATLDVLDVDRARRTTSWWLGESMSHADIAVACVLRFVRDAHASRFDWQRWPQLVAHADRCEAIEPFRSISQPLTVQRTEGPRT